jgi:DNA-binding MarR family transcriptional regulator
MFSAKQFPEVILEWNGVFMHRSMRDFMHLMKESGLSMAQLSLLMKLYYHETCDVSDVGTHLGVTNAAASQMVDRLVQLDLLSRTEDRQDRRVKVLALTPHGRKLIGDSIEARKRWMEELTTSLTVEEQASIVNALTLLTQTARKLEGADSRVRSV